jgi:23S rRNA (cytosine1962-C5)-methyltransferase
MARRHREANGLPFGNADFVRDDVFEDLRRRVREREAWDIVVCDPPAFAKKKSDLERRARLQRRQPAGDDARRPWGFFMTPSARA